MRSLRKDEAPVLPRRSSEECSIIAKRQLASSSDRPRLPRGSEGLDGTSHFSPAMETVKSAAPFGPSYGTDLDDTQHSIDVSELVFHDRPVKDATCFHSSTVSDRHYDIDDDGDYDARRTCCHRQRRSQGSSFAKLRLHHSLGDLGGSNSSRMSMNVSFSNRLEIVHTIPNYNKDVKARCFYSGSELNDFRLEYEFEREGLFPNASVADSFFVK